MNKVVVSLIIMFAAIAFSGIAIAENNASQFKKESVTTENIQKGKQNNNKKKADVSVKKIKKESACCEPDPIKPGSTKSAGNAR